MRDEGDRCLTFKFPSYFKKTVFVRSFVRSFVCLFVRSFVCLFVRSSNSISDPWKARQIAFSVAFVHLFLNSGIFFLSFLFRCFIFHLLFLFLFDFSAVSSLIRVCSILFFDFSFVLFGN